MEVRFFTCQPAAKKLRRGYDQRIRDVKKRKLNDDGSEIDEDDDMFADEGDKPSSSSSSTSSGAINGGQGSADADV